MIKHTLNRIIIVIAFFTLLSCAKEKKEPQSDKEQRAETKDSIVVPSQPETPGAAPMSTHKDTIAKYSPVADPKATGCQMLKKGTFKYKDTDGDDVIVKIVDGVINEEHKGGKYILMSKMTWKGECEYDNMFIMSSLPDFKLEPGTVMNVVIDKIKGDDIYFTATAKGKSYHSILTKIK